jgi:hypothetical protein
MVKNGEIPKEPLDSTPIILNCTYHNCSGNIKRESLDYYIIGIAEGKERRGEYKELRIIAVDEEVLEKKKNCPHCRYLKLNGVKINKNRKIKLDPNCILLTQKELREIKEKLYDEL